MPDILPDEEEKDTNPALALLRQQVLAKAKAIQMGAPVEKSIWPVRYYNKKSGKFYEPHHELERQAVMSDTPRYQLLKGGEGSGKSVAGIVKTLNRLRRGCDGIFLSPDLPHFRISLWTEFQAWCPIEVVYKDEQYKLEPTWKPSQGFEIHFQNEVGGISTLYCGGIADPTGWHGPNVNFAQLDEAHRHPDAESLKTIDGRLRIVNLPNGIKLPPPQVWITSTPKKNWLYTYFGDVDTRAYLPSDPMKKFKDKAQLITLKTKDNEKNTFEGYADDRRLTLSEKEARVYLDAEWEDMAESRPFLETMLYWSRCRDENAPDPSIHHPLLVALDAGVKHDSFGLVAVSAHPDKRNKNGCMIVQAAHVWNPETCPPEYLDVRGALDFRMIRKEIIEMIEGWNIIKIVYDKTELNLMAQDLSERVLVEEFSQQNQRAIADKQLYDLILERRIWHRGDKLLADHVFNADKKIVEDKGMRIVKREQNLKIDLTVCLSMASYAILEYIPKTEGYVSIGTGLNSINALQQLHDLIG